MASTVKYKDLATGNIVTVNNDPSYEVSITVPDSTTAWKLETIDPVHGSNHTDWVGNIPVPKK